MRGGRRIVADVSFALAPGVTTLVGPSGAGKSTLLRALARLVPLAAGAVTLDPAPAVWRRAVAYVPQQPVALEGTVADNVRAGPALFGETVAAAEVERLAAAVGLDPAARAQGLSGGERLRLGLVRALANRPRVLLLDEPTASLDPATAARVLAFVGGLDDLVRLVVTHDPEAVRRLGGRSLRLEAGGALA